jgi:preprotein translocase subunit SecG
MTIILTIIHIIVCFFLVVVVLLQSGKAADLAGAFGGMGSQTAFGPRGSATVLSRATTIAAAVFMLTSLSLAILGVRNSSGSGSVLEKQKAPPPKAAPAQPATPQPGSIQVNTPDGQKTSIPLPMPPGAPGQAPAKQTAPAQAPAKQQTAPAKK